VSPYIITVSQTPEHDGATGFVRSRRAVATLEEARDEAYRIVVEKGFERGRPLLGHMADAIDLYSESGGKVGPLPDGTMIEVTQS
jgi:hypothetical protein